MPINEKANVTVTLNDQQAGAAIEDLESKVKSLRAELTQLKRSDLVDPKKLKATETALKGAEKELRSAKKQVIDLEHVMKNLNKTNLNDLIKAQRSLNNELIRMDRNHPDYKKFKKWNIELKDAIAGVRAEMSGQNNWFQNLSRSANKYFNVLTMGIGVLTGIAFSAKEWISGLVGLDDQMSNVMKTTGLTRKEVRGIFTDMKYFNTRTPRSELLLLAEEAGRLGKKGKADILEFVEVGNKIKTALGDDLGDNAEVAIREVGKLVEIYKVGQKHGVSFGYSMEMIGSAINEVSANSQAQAPFLIEVMKRMGGIADQADFGADKVIGLAATLDNLGQTSEMSATAINKVIVDMFKDSGKYAQIAGMNLQEFTDLLNKDSNEAFIRLLEGLNGSNDGFAVMTKKLDSLDLDGARAIQVLASLAGNTKMLREQQDLANKSMIAATSLTNEYNVKNESMAGNLAIIGQRIRAAFINSGLNKALEGVVGWVAKWAKHDLSDKIQKERIETNKLAIEMTNVNTSASRRNEIYEELKRISPDIVEGISAENIETGKLVKNMTEYNELMIKKIALAEYEKELGEINEEAGKTTQKRIEAEIKAEEWLLYVRDLIAKQNAELGKKADEIILSTMSIEEKKNALLELQRNQKLNISASNTELSNSVYAYKKALEKETEATTAANLALQKYADIKARLLDNGSNPETTSESSSGGNNGSNNIPSFSKAAEDLMEVIQQVNAFISAEMSKLRKEAGISAEYFSQLAQKLYETQHNMVGDVAKLEEEKLSDNPNQIWDTPELQQAILIEDYKRKLYKETWDYQREQLKKHLDDNLISLLEYNDQIRAIDRIELENKLEVYSILFGGLENLFKESSIAFRVAASARAIIDTYLAATAALAPPPEGYGPLLGPLAAVGIITAGLANVAKINDVSFFEGGYTGDGSPWDRTQGNKHKHEYVIPSWMMANPMVLDIAGVLEGLRTSGSVSNTYHNNYQTNTYQNQTGDQDMVRILKEIRDEVSKPVRGKWVYKDFEKIEEEVSDIRSSVTR